MAECLTQQAILGGIWCIQNGMADPQCQENADMLEWPICPDVPPAPLPECLSPEQVAGINYCHYGNGEEPYYDGICWAAQRDPQLWERYINVSPCTIGAGPHAPPSGGPAKANMLYVGIGLAAVLGMAGFMFVKKKGKN